MAAQDFYAKETISPIMQKLEGRIAVSNLWVLP
jgi:hypothetical protein